MEDKTFIALWIPLSILIFISLPMATVFPMLDYLGVDLANVPLANLLSSASKGIDSTAGFSGKSSDPTTLKDNFASETVLPVYGDGKSFAKHRIAGQVCDSQVPVGTFKGRDSQNTEVYTLHNPVEGRFFRLRIHENFGSHYIGVNKLEFLDAAQQPIQSIRIFAASGEESLAANVLTDQNWWTTGDLANIYLDFDLGESRTVTGIRMWASNKAAAPKTMSLLRCDTIQPVIRLRLTDRRLLFMATELFKSHRRFIFSDTYLAAKDGYGYIVKIVRYDFHGLTPAVIHLVKEHRVQLKEVWPESEAYGLNFGKYSLVEQNVAAPIKTPAASEAPIEEAVPSQPPDNTGHPTGQAGTINEAGETIGANGEDTSVPEENAGPTDSATHKEEDDSASGNREDPKDGEL